MYPNFVQYAVIRQKHGVLLVFSPFIITFFHPRFFLVFTLNVVVVVFFSSGTADNKYLKVPQSKMTWW